MASARLKLGRPTTVARGVRLTERGARAAWLPDEALQGPHRVDRRLSDELEEAIAHRELDFAIVHPPSPRDDLITHEAAREPFVAVVPADHRLADRASLSVADLVGERLLGVRRDVGRVSFDHVVAYLVRGGAKRLDFGLVAAGAGIALVVESLTCIQR